MRLERTNKSDELNKDIKIGWKQKPREFDPQAHYFKIEGFNRDYS